MWAVFILPRKFANFEIRRYRTLVFWLYAKPEVLESRLDTRVEKMVDVSLFHPGATKMLISTFSAVC